MGYLNEVRRQQQFNEEYNFTVGDPVTVETRTHLLSEPGTVTNATRFENFIEVETPLSGKKYYLKSKVTPAF